MGETDRCDVTGVTAGRDYVPLAADMPREDAQELAAQYSTTARWSAVLVKVSRTGQITDTYVKGERQPA